VASSAVRVIIAVGPSPSCATLLIAAYRLVRRIISKYTVTNTTSGSAMAEGPRDALVSRNSATTKYPIVWHYLRDPTFSRLKRVT